MHFVDAIRAVPVFPGDPLLKAKVIRQPEAFRAGGAFKKFLVGCELPDGRRVTLVERAHDNDLVANYIYMRQVGLPVVDTMHWDQERGTVIMPDVKAEGEELYGKSLRFLLQRGEKRHRPSPEADKHFYRLMQNEQPVGRENRILTIVEGLAAMATYNSIFLARDDPFDLRMRPDGKWNLIHLDIAQAQIPGGRYGPRRHEHPIDAHNAECVRRFMTWLHGLEQII